MEVEVELDQFKLTVEITRLINDLPDPTCRDSADDFRGTRELEWRLVYAIHYDKNGKPDECGYAPKWLRWIKVQHDEEITAAIWAKYDEAAE